MAGNEWLGGYLDAILDSGPALGADSGRAKGDGGDKAAATKYFLTELTGSEEGDLHRTWQKATALKNTHERGSRVENFCWRIWHLTRKKKQMQWEDAQRLAQRRVEIEEGRADVTEDMPEDMEEESDKAEATSDSAPSALPKGEAGAEEGDRDDRRLYVVMISLHGLVRGDNMELGRDSDTGGQVKYVVEFARALAALPQVYRVDLLTRQILSKEVDWSYGEPTEMLTGMGDENDVGGGESGGAYIVRIPCGPREEYIRKELLWPYIPEFVDGALSHVVHMANVLGEQMGGGQPVWPHMVHGHYADAGDIAGLLSGAMNVPMVLTGHSLGRNKLEQLLKQGRQTPESINATYKIMRRIEAEEFALDSSELVITSTRQEIDQQWGLYDGFDVKLERVLRARQRRGVSCHGRFMPRMAVIPPGMDFSSVVEEAPDLADQGTDLGGAATSRPDPPIWAEVMRFFTNPRKPMILALARPDPKKNLLTLIRAYGECKPLRDLANMVLIMGNRDDIDEMSSGNAEVLTSVLKLIDRYDMYGQVAYPKHHKQHDVPEIYRLAAKSKGVFVNPALVEPFGLTLIEAAAHGLPMVATKNGGPVDIHRVLSNGVLVDPHDQQGIADALLQLVGDRHKWAECRQNGLKNIHSYSWPEHCKNYLGKVAQCRGRHPNWRGDALVDLTDNDSQGDSLRDADLSLRLSIDGKSLGGASLTTGADLERLLAERDALPSRRAAGQRSMGLQPMQEEDSKPAGEAQAASQASSAGAVLRKRKGLVVIALDSYEPTGEAGPSSVAALRAVLAAVKPAKHGGVGLALATALSGAEALALMEKAGMALGDLDVVIAGSGSEVYYVAAHMGEGGKGQLADGQGRQLVLDADYEGHIAYRWGGDGLRKSMARVIASVNEGVKGEGSGSSSQSTGLTEDTQRCGTHRLVYRVRDPTQAPPTQALRKRLRMRGLRCHVVYCRSATTLHLLPLHASRAQALRYLFVRWGLDVANMAVVVGPTGDGDHVELVSGTHKTFMISPYTIPSEAARALMATTEDDASDTAPNVQKLDTAKSMDALAESVKKLQLRA